MAGHGSWRIGSVFADTRESEEKAKQAAGEDQKHKQKRCGAKSSVALFRLFPARPLLKQL